MNPPFSLDAPFDLPAAGSISVVRPGPSANLVRDVALLAGLGRQAGELVQQAASLETPPGEQGRTCIDGGSQMMLSLLAPGGRALRLLQRAGPPAAGAAPWVRLYAQPGAAPQGWRTDVLLGEPPTAWDRARRLAEEAGALDRLQAVHALLGPFGRIYSLSWSLDAPEQVEVSWQLDRRAPLERLLHELGLPQAWTLALPIFRTLLDFPLTTRNGPWSILLRLDGREASGESCLRLGSSNWARNFEDDGKRRRLAAMVAQLGGDGRFAEAVYKLLDARRAGRRGLQIGRALELEWRCGEFAAAEFFLSVPDLL